MRSLPFPRVAHCRCPYDPATGGPGPRKSHFQFLCDAGATAGPDVHVAQRSVGECGSTGGAGGPAMFNGASVNDICRVADNHVSETCCVAGCPNKCTNPALTTPEDCAVGSASICNNVAVLAATPEACSGAGGYWGQPPPCPGCWQSAGSTCGQMNANPERGNLGINLNPNFVPAFGASRAAQLCNYGGQPVEAGSTWEGPVGVPSTWIGECPTDLAGTGGLPFAGSDRIWQGCGTSNAPAGCCDYDFTIKTALACKPGAPPPAAGPPGKCSIKGVATPTACVQKGGTWGPDHPKMSGGTVFALVVVGLVAAYVLAGMVYGKYAHGRFAHPHANCAGGAIRLCGDGVSFSLNGCHLLPAGGYKDQDQEAGKGGNVFSFSSELVDTKHTRSGSAGSGGGRGEMLGASDAIAVADDQEAPGYQSI